MITTLILNEQESKRFFTLIAKTILLVAISFGTAAHAELEARDKVGVVLYSSLGGAVLGLSTLSFYDSPNKHTDNVFIGAGVGLIAGLSYLGYRAMSTSAASSAVIDANTSSSSPRENLVFSVLPDEKRGLHFLLVSEF